MKALFALFTAFLIVFFFGCQESTITDPGMVNDNVAQQIQNPPNKELISHYPYVLEIPKSVFDPTHPQNGGTEIKGFIRYDIQSLQDWTIADRTKYELETKYYINLLMYPHCPKQDQHKTMEVVGLASELVGFNSANTNSPQVVTKEFNVCQCCCGCMKIVLKFNVFEKEVELRSLELVRVYNTPPMSEF